MSIFKFFAYDNPNLYDRKYHNKIKLHNRIVFNRRVLFANIGWILINILLTKVGIMQNSIGNLLNVAAFLLTAGSIVQKNFHIGKFLWKLESGATIVSIAIWISNLM